MSIKSYTKNLVRSFGFATSENIRDRTGNIRDFKDSASMHFYDANKFFKERRSELNKTSSLFSRQNIFSTSSTIIKDALSDIKTGKFYDPNREDDVDWDSIDDYSFGDDNEFTESEISEKKENLRGKLNSRDRKANTLFLSKSFMQGTSAMIEQNKASTALLYNQNLAGFGATVKSIERLGGITSGGLEAIHNYQKSMLDNQAQFFSESLKLQKEQLEELKKMSAGLSTSDKSANVRTSAYSQVKDGYGISFRKYGNHILKNIDNSGDLSTLVQMIPVLKLMASQESGGRMIKDPLKVAVTTAVDKMIAPGIKKNIDDMNEVMGNATDLLLKRITDFSDSNNKLLATFGKIFGVEQSVSKLSDKSDKYNKGRVPWDGKSKKALEEVIPMYLAQITSALTGSEMQVFNYDTGKFTTKSAVKSSITGNTKKFSRRNAGLVSSTMDDYLKHQHGEGSSEYRSFSEKLDKFYEDLFVSGKELSASTINSSNLDPHLKAALIKVYNKKRGSMDKYNNRMNNINSINSYNNSLGDFGDITNVLFNGFGGGSSSSSGSGKSNKPTGGLVGTLLFDTKDKYNMSLMDYMKKISDYLGGANSNRPPNTGVSNYNRNNMNRTSSNSSRVVNNLGFGMLAGQISMSEDSSEAALSSLDDFLNGGNSNNNEDEIYDKDFNGIIDKFTSASKKIQGRINNNKINKFIESGTRVASNVLHKALIGDEDDKNKSLVQHLKDIFDDENSMMGKYLKRVEATNFANNRALIVGMVKEAVGPLVNRFKETNFYQRVAPVISDIKEDMKEKFGIGKRAVTSSVSETFNDLKKSQDKAKAKIANKAAERKKREDDFIKSLGYNPDDIPHFAEGGHVEKDTIASLSEGEFVVTPEGFNMVKSAIDHLHKVFIGDESFDGSKYFKPIGNAVKGAGKNLYTKAKSGIQSGGNFIREEILDPNDLKAIAEFGKEVTSSITGLTFSKDDKADSKIKSIRSEVGKAVKNRTASLISSGALGMGAALLTGAVGGPLAGAAVGVGLDLVKNSSVLQNMLFGTETSKGLVPKGMVEGVKKYFPDFKKYGLASAALSFVPGMPFGILGGLAIGGAATFVKNNQSFQHTMFGEDGIFESDIAQYLSANHKKLLLGAIGGTMLGPFGFLGNVMLGSGLTAVTTSQSFKTGLLGGKDENGVYTDGVLPSIREKVVKPLADFAKSVPKNAGKWLVENIVGEIKYALTPFTKSIKYNAKSLVKGITNGLKENFKNSLVIPIYAKLEKTIIDPLVNKSKQIFGLGLNILKKTLTAPVKVLRTGGDFLRGRHIKNGIGGTYMTANEQLEYIARRNLKVDDTTLNNLSAFRNLNHEDLTNINDALTAINYSEGGSRRLHQYLSQKGTDEAMRITNGKIPVVELSKLSKVIAKGQTDKIAREVSRLTHKFKLTEEEKQALMQFAIKRRGEVQNILDNRANFTQNKVDMLKKYGITATKGSNGKYNISDLLSQARTELKFNGVVADKTGKDPNEITNVDKLTELTEKYNNVTMEYRSTLLGKISDAISLLGTITLGMPTSDPNSRNRKRANAILKGLGFTEEEASKANEMGDNKEEGRFKSTLNANGGLMGLAFNTAIANPLEKLYGVTSNAYGRARTTRGLLDGVNSGEYEYTEDGLIKKETNDAGEVEIDETDATTKRTLEAKRKREEKEFELHKKDKDSKDKDTGKEGKDKKSLFGKIAALGALLGGGIMNKIKGIGGILGGAGNGGGLLGGGVRILSSLGPLGMLGAFVLAAPYLSDTVAPWIAKNYETKIEPFITEKAVPATVKIISTLAPFFIKGVVATVKTAFKLLMKDFPKLIHDSVSKILGGSGLSNTLEELTGGEPDRELQYDENGNIVEGSTKGGYDDDGMNTFATITGRNILGGYVNKSLAFGRALGQTTVGKGLSKTGRFISKVPGLKTISKVTKTLVKAPVVAQKGIDAVVNGTKGNRMALFKESLNGNIAKNYTGAPLKGFRGLFNKEKQAAEAAMDAIVGNGEKNIKNKILGSITKLLKKFASSKLVKGLVGEKIVERLLNGGIQEVAEKVGESVIKNAGKGAAKNGVKSGLKAVAGIATGGLVTAAFSVYDAYDGWHHAYKYLGLAEDQQDEIPLGMKFMSSLFNVLSGLIGTFTFGVGSMILSPELMLNIYKSTIAPIFGEESVNKIDELKKTAKEELAQYNKDNGTHYTRKQLDKKKKYDKRSKTTFGRILNGITDLWDGIKSVFSFKDRKTPFNRNNFGNGTNGTTNTPLIAGYGAGRGPDVKPTGSTSSSISSSSHYYSQRDPRWSNTKIQSATIGDAGCGPTAIAMALSDATGKTITPDKVAADNKEHLPGYSTWGLFPSVAQKYNLGYNRVQPTAHDLVNNLKEGEVILSGVRRNQRVGESPFTNAGHIVVAKGIKDGKVEIADPRGKSYNKLYDLDSVLNETTLGFRYTPNEGSADLVGSYAGRGGYAGGADEQAQALGLKVANFAKSIQPKVRYNYGSYSISPDQITTDCSGFVKYVYKEAANMNLPRTSSEQGRLGKAISGNEAKAGDICGYSGHVGIFIDDQGNVIHNSMPGVNVIVGNYKKAGNNPNPRRILGEGDLAAGGANGNATAATSNGAPTPDTSAPTAQSFFGKIGTAFMKAGAELFGLPWQESAPAAANTTGGTTTASYDGEIIGQTVQSSAMTGLDIPINRVDNVTAEQLDAFLKTKHADPDLNGKALLAAAKASSMSPVDIMAWAGIESGWGKSRISRAKNNFFGIGAFDSSPGKSAYTYNSRERGLIEGAKWIAKHYIFRQKPYPQNTLRKVFNPPDGQHDYSTDDSEPYQIDNLRKSFYASIRAGKGPDEAYAAAYGKRPTTHADRRRIAELESELSEGKLDSYAGGADDGTDPAMLNGFPYYRQYNPEFFSDKSKRMAACGPTSLAMVATASTGKRVTPTETGNKVLKNGIWTDGGHGGSAHDIFIRMGPEYGFKAVANRSTKEFFEHADKNEVQFALGSGPYGVAPYFGGGHYIVVLGNKDGKYIINNPVSVKSSGAFSKGAVSPSKGSWRVIKDGKPMLWTGQGFTIAADNASNPPPAGEAAGVPKGDQVEGGDPGSMFFSKIGNAFLNAGASLFGLDNGGSSAPATTTTPTDGSSTDGTTNPSGIQTTSKPEDLDNAGSGIGSFFTKSLNAKVSSTFGPRNVRGFGKFHTGTDFDTKGNSSPILSPIAGIVRKSASDRGRGQFIMLEDEYGGKHYFDHLSERLAKPGDYIQVHDVLGRVGSTGLSKGKHLHYEVMDKKDRSIDPNEYYKKYGSFGGVENKKVVGVLDADLNKKAKEAYYAAKLKSNRVHNRLNTVDINRIATTMIQLLTNISNNTGNIINTNKILTTIVEVLSKHGDKLPEEAKKKISKLAKLTQDVAKMQAINQYAGSSDEPTMVNSDIREVFDIMNAIASK